MKIYNKIVIDMDTGDTLEEDSFEYDGPVALCVSSSSSSGQSSQQMMDPEAARRMAAVAERNAALGEEQWKVYQDTFRPYETALAKSNERMIAPNEQYTTEALKAQTSLIPQRTEASREGLTSITQELRSSRPVVGRFYEEALNGANVQNRMAQAGADVAQNFDNSMSTGRRNMTRMGIGANSSAITDTMSKFGMGRAKAMAGAMTGARTATENENFGRLSTAMQARSGALSGAASTTPYQTGNVNNGAFSLQSPSTTALGAFGNSIQANNAGFNTLTTSQNSGSGWGFL